MRLSFTQQLGRDRQGVATVEFALWAVMILVALVPCLDFGTYLLQDARMSAAVGEAALLAYDMRNTTVNTSQLSQYVTSGSGLQAASVTATFTCNGGLQSCTTAPANQTCACPTGINPVSYIPAASCGFPCASGATSGFYLTVKGSHTFQSILPDRWLNGQAMTSATTVRLQ